MPTAPRRHRQHRGRRACFHELCAHAVGSLRVQRGQVIRLGDVVETRGYHQLLEQVRTSHFEVLLNGKTPTEPMAWLAAPDVASTVVTVPDAPAVVNQ